MGGRGGQKFSSNYNGKYILFKNPKCALAGRKNKFLPAWKLLIKDQELLALVQGYQIPLLMEPVQEKAPKVLDLNQEQQQKVDLK